MTPDIIKFSGPYPLLPAPTERWALGEMTYPGVYLFTVKIRNSYRIMYVGEAYDVAERLRDHLRNYLSGRYWVYDYLRLAAGTLTNPVHKPTMHTEEIFGAFDEFNGNLNRMLKAVEIFVGKLPADKPTLRHVESAIIRELRQHREADDFLENVRLSTPISPQPSTVTIESEATLFALPRVLQV